MDWRRLIELRVYPSTWVLTPAFPEKTVRLSYPFNRGCQAVLVSRSPDFYPVQLSNVRSFSIKSESDIFEAAPSVFPIAGLAFKAVPRDYRQQDDAHCRVLIEVFDQNQNQPQWENLALINGWENYGNPVAPIGCCIDSLQTVWLRGIAVGTNSTNSVICVLPGKFRPTYRKVFTVVTGLPGYGDSFGRVDVLADGSVILLSGQSGYVSLDNVAFKLGS